MCDKWILFVVPSDTNPISNKGDKDLVNGISELHFARFGQSDVNIPKAVRLKSRAYIQRLDFILPKEPGFGKKRTINRNKQVLYPKTEQLGSRIRK